MGDDPHSNDKHCPSCRCSIDNEELANDLVAINVYSEYYTVWGSTEEIELPKGKSSKDIKEIYLGGGSPTYYKEEEFKYLVKRLL